MAVYLDSNGGRLDRGAAIVAGPNRYGVEVGTRGKVVSYNFRTGRVRVEFYRENGKETRVMPASTVARV